MINTSARAHVFDSSGIRIMHGLHEFRDLAALPIIN